MTRRTESLDGRVVVLTDATSGVGRATALEFTRRGARLVLAGRGGEDLIEITRRCARAGGDAVAVPTDVTREDEVRALAEAARQRWGGIDVWVNNAGVAIVSRLEDAPFEAHRRVIETNLFGAMHAARAVLPIFKAQGGGVLIDTSSVLARLGQPLLASYAISKHGLRGLAESLRAELADEPDIHVCSVVADTMDAPQLEDRDARLVRPLAAMQSPDEVARAIVGLALRPRREIHVPRAALLGLAAHALFPKTTGRLLLRARRSWRPAGPRRLLWLAAELARIEIEALRRRWHVLTAWRRTVSLHRGG